MEETVDKIAVVAADYLALAMDTDAARPPRDLTLCVGLVHGLKGLQADLGSEIKKGLSV